jgi:hypothetical protein
MFLQVAYDGGLKIDDAAEGAAPQPLLSEKGEKAFNGIEPGGRCRVKWKVHQTRTPQPNFESPEWVSALARAGSCTRPC